MHIFIYKKGCVCNECLISRHSHYRLKSKCVCVHFIFTLFSEIDRRDEFYRAKVLGTKQRGQPTDPPLDHVTGAGHVKESRGQYHDAFLVKKSIVIVFLVEAGSGGICPQGVKSINFLHERAKGVRDGTQYGKSNIATRSFRRHHTQRISFAVVAQDAHNIAHNVKHGKIREVAVSAARFM